MKALVLYESIYGNTAAIAGAIAAGLRPDHPDVELRPVDGSADGDLMVVGAPTHAHGLPSAMSRKGLEKAAADAEARGETLQYHPTAGMRQFIETLPQGHGRPVACFDTRFDKSPVLTGSAAKTMAKRLRRRGYTVVATESFFVVDSEGPLADGELERAEAWGASLTARVEPAR